MYTDIAHCAPHWQPLFPCWGTTTLSQTKPNQNWTRNPGSWLQFCLCCFFTNQVLLPFPQLWNGVNVIRFIHPIEIWQSYWRSAWHIGSTQERFEEWMKDEWMYLHKEHYLQGRGHHLFTGPPATTEAPSFCLYLSSHSVAGRWETCPSTACLLFLSTRSDLHNWQL